MTLSFGLALCIFAYAILFVFFVAERARYSKIASAGLFSVSLLTTSLAVWTVRFSHIWFVDASILMSIGIYTLYGILGPEYRKPLRTGIVFALSLLTLAQILFGISAGDAISSAPLAAMSVVGSTFVGTAIFAIALKILGYRFEITAKDGKASPQSRPLRFNRALNLLQIIVASIFSLAPIHAIQKSTYGVVFEVERVLLINGIFAILVFACGVLVSFVDSKPDFRKLPAPLLCITLLILIGFVAHGHQRQDTWQTPIARLSGPVFVFSVIANVILLTFARSIGVEVKRLVPELNPLATTTRRIMVLIAVVAIILGWAKYRIDDQMDELIARRLKPYARVALEEIRGSQRVTAVEFYPFKWSARFSKDLQRLRHIKSIRANQFDFPIDVKAIDDSISNLTSLTRLDISGKAVGDEQLKRLANLKKLEHLSIVRTQITDQGLAALKRLPALESIAVPPIKGPGLVHLRDLPNLKQVDLTGHHHLLPEHIKLLPDWLESIKFPRGAGRLFDDTWEFYQLRELAFYSHRFKPEDWERLNRIDQLETLTLGSCSWDRMSSLLEHPSIRKLDVSRTSVTDADLGVFAKMPLLQVLKITNLGETDVDFDGPGIGALAKSGKYVVYQVKERAKFDGFSFHFGHEAVWFGKPITETQLGKLLDWHESVQMRGVLTLAGVTIADGRKTAVMFFRSEGRMPPIRRITPLMMKRLGALRSYVKILQLESPKLRGKDWSALAKFATLENLSISNVDARFVQRELSNALARLKQLPNFSEANVQLQSEEANGMPAFDASKFPGWKLETNPTNWSIRITRSP